MAYFAHSGNEPDKSDWQTMPEHAAAVVRMAEVFASCFGLAKASRVAGLFHDLGKYDPAFQRAPRERGAPRRCSTAGAAILRSIATGTDAEAAELVMYAILGHHAGLPHRRNPFGHSFDRRIEGFADRLDPIWRTGIDCDIAGLLHDRLLGTILERMESAAFDLLVFVRFISSCLVDADFNDTERHFAALEGRQPHRDWPLLKPAAPLIARFDTRMSGFKRYGEINVLRHDVLAHARVPRLRARPCKGARPSPHHLRDPLHFDRRPNCGYVPPRSRRPNIGAVAGFQPVATGSGSRRRTGRRRLSSPPISSFSRACSRQEHRGHGSSTTSPVR